MVDKDGTGRRRKKLKRSTIRVPSDEVPRRPTSSPLMDVVPTEEDGLEDVDIRVTPVPEGEAVDDSEGAADVGVAATEKQVDVELAAGMLEMFDEPVDGPVSEDRISPRVDPLDAAAELEVDVDVDSEDPARPAAVSDYPVPTVAVPNSNASSRELPERTGIRRSSQPRMEPGSPTTPGPSTGIRRSSQRRLEPIAPTAARPSAANPALPQPHPNLQSVIVAPIRSIGVPAVDTPRQAESPAPELRPAAKPLRFLTPLGMGAVRLVDDVDGMLDLSGGFDLGLRTEDLDDWLPAAAKETAVPVLSAPAAPAQLLPVAMQPVVRDATGPVLQREERESDPGTPIDIEESSELFSEAASAADPLATLPMTLGSPVPAPSAVPPPPPPVVKPISAPPPPPPDPSLSNAERPTVVVPRPKKRRKKWWEDFFGEEYLRTLPAISQDHCSRECDFIESSLGVERGAALLDLGCGPGHHSVTLASRGYSVVGLDLSLPMLTRAALLAEDAGQAVNFLQADMREMTFESSFDGVFCIGTTFGLFDEESNVQVIRNVHRALKENGTLLVEIANRDFALKAQPNLVWFEGDGCPCMEETDFNYITSRLHVKRTVILEDGAKRETGYSVRLYSLHELGTVLHRSGFRVTEVSGHFATRGAFFGLDSPRLILLAEKRPSTDLGSSASPGEGPESS